MKALGFSQVRVRHHGDVARIEVDGEEIERLVAQRERVVDAVRKAGLQVRLGGSRGLLHRQPEPDLATTQQLTSSIDGRARRRAEPG